MLQAMQQTESEPAFSGFGAGFGAASATIKQVQTDVNTLNRLVGVGGTLATDGLIGPATTAAVNKALAGYVTSAPATLRTGNLTSAQIVSNASAIALYLERTIAAHGVPSAASLPAAAAASAAVPATSSIPANPAQIKTLQAAIASLGAIIGDTSIKLTADGVIGPATTAAVNRALTVHIGSGQAPAQFRTGHLTASDISYNIAALTTLVQREAARRQGVATGQTVTAAATGLYQNLTSPQVATLQNAVNQLAATVGDTSIKVPVNSMVGPELVNAVNRIFTVHIGSGQAAAQFRTGKLTAADVLMQSPTLTSLILAEVSRRASASGSASAAAKAAAAATAAIAAAAAAHAIAPNAATTSVNIPGVGPIDVPVPDSLAPYMPAGSQLTPAPGVVPGPDAGIAPPPDVSVPLTQRKWFWPAVGGVGLIGIAAIATTIMRRRSPQYLPQFLQPAPQPRYSAPPRERAPARAPAPRAQPQPSMNRALSGARLPPRKIKRRK